MPTFPQFLHGAAVSSVALFVMTFANTFANGLLFANKYPVRVRVRGRGPAGVRVRVRVRARGPGGVRVRVRVRVRPIFHLHFF